MIGSSWDSGAFYTNSENRASIGQQVDPHGSAEPNSLRLLGTDRPESRSVSTSFVQMDMFSAEIELLPTAEGGRRTPIEDGYRPDVWINGHFHGVSLQFRGELAPGESGIVMVVPLVPHLWPPISAGVQFNFMEGLRVVGKGTVR